MIFSFFILQLNSSSFYLTSLASFYKLHIWENIWRFEFVQSHLAAFYKFHIWEKHDHLISFSVILKIKNGKYFFRLFLLFLISVPSVNLNHFYIFINFQFLPLRFIAILIARRVVVVAREFFKNQGEPLVSAVAQYAGSIVAREMWKKLIINLLFFCLCEFIYFLNWGKYRSFSHIKIAHIFTKIPNLKNFI